MKLLNILDKKRQKVTSRIGSQKHISNQKRERRPIRKRKLYIKEQKSMETSELI